MMLKAKNKFLNFLLMYYRKFQIFSSSSKILPEIFNS